MIRRTVNATRKTSVDQRIAPRRGWRRGPFMYSAILRDVQRLAPSPRVFLRGEGGGEGQGARGVLVRSIRRTATSFKSSDARRGAPLAPLPYPLLGVPGRGSEVSHHFTSARALIGCFSAISR